MVVFRALIFLLLLGSGVCFAFFATTGQQRFKRWGLMVLKWTLFAAVGFFAVLILERIA